MTTMLAAIGAPLAVVALLVYATMRALRSSVSPGRRVPPRAVGEGRPDGEAAATSRVAPRRGEPGRDRVQRWFDALFLIAQDGCEFEKEGGTPCRLLPDLARDGVPWCPACRAFVALNPSTTSLPADAAPGSEAASPSARTVSRDDADGDASHFSP